MKFRPITKFVEDYGYFTGTRRLPNTHFNVLTAMSCLPTDIKIMYLSARLRHHSCSYQVMILICHVSVDMIISLCVQIGATFGQFVDCWKQGENLI